VRSRARPKLAVGGLAHGRRAPPSVRIDAVLALAAVLLLLPVTSVRAAASPDTLRGGIVINEVLIDPNSSTLNFDTDGNGTAETEDEFIEIYNLSGSAIDIGGLEL
jgi:hypothetical protein